MTTSSFSLYAQKKRAMERIGVVKTTLQPYDDQVYTKITVQASASTPLGSLESAIARLSEMAQAVSQVTETQAPADPALPATPACSQGEAAEVDENDSEDEEEEKSLLGLMPKRPLSAYMHYVQDVVSIDVVLKSKPIAEKGRLIGDAWKALADEQKKFYIDVASAGKEQYAKNMQRYRDFVAKNKPPAPSKSPYYWFFTSIRDRVKRALPTSSEGVDESKVAGKILDEWNVLPQWHKDSYFEMAQTDQKRFYQEMSEYEAAVAAYKKEVGLLGSE